MKGKEEGLRFQTKPYLKWIKPDRCLDRGRGLVSKGLSEWFLTTLFNKKIIFGPCDSQKINLIAYWKILEINVKARHKLNMFYVDKKYQKRIYFLNIYMNDVYVWSKNQKKWSIYAVWVQTLASTKTHIDTEKRIIKI